MKRARIFILTLGNESEAREFRVQYPKADGDKFFFKDCRTGKDLSINLGAFISMRCEQEQEQ